MIETVAVNERLTLDDYEAVVHLTEAVRSLRTEALSLVPPLAGRTIWMVNSTARGGGVAEMMPRMITILRELGVRVEWVVIGSDNPDFFTLTKRLHNLIHGSGDPDLTADDRAVYDAVSRANADALRSRVRPGDLLVMHDPQPLGSGHLLRRELDVRTVFRCHIGLDESSPQTRAAWGFLKPYASSYDHAVFTAPEYIPDFLAGRTGIIRPAIDPLGHKNRDLLVPRLTGTLCSARLVVEQHPVVRTKYAEIATRLAPDGRFLPADDGGRHRAAVPARRDADLEMGSVEGVQAAPGCVRAAQAARRRRPPPRKPPTGISAGCAWCGWCWPGPIRPPWRTIRKRRRCWRSW